MTHAYNEENVLIKYDKGVKNQKYRYYPNSDLDLVFVESYDRIDGVNVRGYFKKPVTNIFANVGLGGESEAHRDAKLLIVEEKKYFDTIFNKWIHFDKCIPEMSHQLSEWEVKKPDINCYDNKGKLVMCIEIYYTHKKSSEDIEQLKKLQVPIVEINIKHDNKCDHIVLPALLEANRSKYQQLLEKNRRIERENQSKYRTGENSTQGVIDAIRSQYKQIESIEAEQATGYSGFDSPETYLIESDIKINNSEIERIKGKIESCISKTKQIIKDLREYSNKRAGNDHQSELFRENQRIENEIKEVEGLIEINAFYSDSQTDTFLWIN